MSKPSKTLAPEGYKLRLIEKRLDGFLEAFGCVEITGPKWCGKTWTGMTRAASIVKLDEPAQREAAKIDPSLTFIGEKPCLIDEWQEVPEVWDAARRYVDDAGNERGLLIMTGSTALKKKERVRVRHTGAGRIGRLEMYPMSLCELDESSAQISLKGLLDEEEQEACTTSTSVEEVARWCCRGGWPANLNLPDSVAFETASQYIQSILDINIIEEGKSPDTALTLLHALAVNVSQAVSYKTLGKDMSHGEKSPDVDTIASYLELFDRLKITQQVRGWEPPMRSKARVRVKPKRYFCDPSLPAALLGANPQGLLRDAQTLGLLFENLVLRDLSVFLSTYEGLGNNVYYYRDTEGLEVDAILEYKNRWAGIEIKLSDAKIDEAAKNLLTLKKKTLANPSARNTEPLFLAVVVGCGSIAYKRKDGIWVIPIAVLGA